MVEEAADTCRSGKVPACLLNREKLFTQMEVSNAPAPLWMVAASGQHDVTKDPQAPGTLARWG